MTFSEKNALWYFLTAHRSRRGSCLVRYVTAGRSAKYCDERVCMSVCLSARISRKPHVQTSKNFSARVTRGRGSVLLGWECNTLCTSGFVDYRPACHPCGECTRPSPALCRHYALIASTAHAGGGRAHSPPRGVTGGEVAEADCLVFTTQSARDSCATPTCGHGVFLGAIM